MQVNIGDKIRELRKRDGRKQEDVAKRIRCNGAGGFQMGIQRMLP